MTEAGQKVPVEETTGFALARACRAHRVSVGAALAPLGLHVGQEMFLLELWREDGLKVGDLAARLRVEPPTVTRMLRRLENCGLVERRKDPDDARGIRVYLTEKGRALEGPVTGCWEEVEARTFGGMSDEEKRALRGLLARIRENLDAV